MTDHPIAPPSELVHQWHREACRDPYTNSAFFMSRTLKYIAAQAASWGWRQRDASVPSELQEARDEELQACCEWVEREIGHGREWGAELRRHRRPKPQSLAEEAQKALAHLLRHSSTELGSETIRRALERLQELEGLEATSQSGAN